MPGGRFASTLIAPYETCAVYDNTSGAAASITINTTSVDAGVDHCIGIKLTNQNTCVQCSTTHNSGTFCYALHKDFEVEANNNYIGLVCYCLSNTCSRHLNEFYIKPNGTCCNGAGIGRSLSNRTSPIPHICTIGPDPNWCVGVLPVITHCCTLALINLRCLCIYGGTVSTETLFNCIYSTQLGIDVAACCTSSYGLFGTNSCVNSTYVSSDIAIDYWSSGRPVFFLRHDSPSCAGMFSLNSACIPCSRTQTCFQVSDYCNVNCCICIMPCSVNWICTALGAPDYCCSITCLGACRAYFERQIFAGCGIVAYQALQTCRFTMKTYINTSAINCCATCAADNPSCIFCRDCGSGSIITFPGNDNLSTLKWLTYNHCDCKNYFMLYSCSGRDTFNGIYSIDRTQLMCHLNIRPCAGFCVNNTWCIPSCGTSLPTCLYTKVSNIPSILCCISSTNFVSTVPVATGTCEWTMHAADFSTLPLQFRRYVSNDLANWSERSACVSYSIINSCAFVVGNTNIIRSVTSNYANICNSGMIESAVTGQNIERTGIVVSNQDKTVIRNLSDKEIAVNIWGYTE
jgi:hypothetical protein